MTNDYDKYQNERNRLATAINKAKIEIDYSVFEKTENEKMDLKWAKQEWKRTRNR